MLIFVKDKCKTVGTKRQTLSEYHTLMSFEKKHVFLANFSRKQARKRFALLQTLLSPFEC